MEQIYDVLPGFDWVAGQRVPANRKVSLTPAAAAFDLGLGRIVLATGQPTPQPEEPVKDADVVTLRRGDLVRTATVAEVAAFTRKGKIDGQGIKATVKLTQAAYDALATKDAETLYVIAVA